MQFEPADSLVPAAIYDAPKNCANTQELQDNAQQTPNATSEDEVAVGRSNLCKAQVDEIMADNTSEACCFGVAVTDPSGNLLEPASSEYPALTSDSTARDDEVGTEGTMPQPSEEIYAGAARTGDAIVPSSSEPSSNSCQDANSSPSDLGSSLLEKRACGTTDLVLTRPVTYRHSWHRPRIESSKKQRLARMLATSPISLFAEPGRATDCDSLSQETITATCDLEGQCVVNRCKDVAGVEVSLNQSATTMSECEAGECSLDARRTSVDDAIANVASQSLVENTSSVVVEASNSALEVVSSHIADTNFPPRDNILVAIAHANPDGATDANGEMVCSAVAHNMDSGSSAPAHVATAMVDVPKATPASECALREANEQDAQALNLDVRASSGAMVRIRIRKSKPLKRLMQASRQALSLNAGEQLTFFSDGRTLRPEDTAASLGLTDGSILEVRTVAKKSPDSVVADNSLQVHMQPGSGKKKGFAASTSANDPYGTHSGPRCKRGKTEVGAIDNSISANIDASWERYRASRLAELRAELEDKWTHLVKDDQTVDLLAMRFGWGTSETLTVATGGRISEELDQLIAERVRAVARSSKSCDGIGSEETVQQTVSKHVDGLDNAILNASNDTALELLRKLALDEARMPSPLLIFFESCCSIKTLSSADVNSALARWPKLGEVHRKALWSIVLHRATLQDKAIEAVLHETGRQVQGAVSSARNAFTEFVEKQHSQNVTKGAVGMHPESVIDAQSAFLQKSEAELVAQLTIEHWPWQLPSKIDGFSLTGVL